MSSFFARNFFGECDCFGYGMSLSTGGDGENFSNENECFSHGDKDIDVIRPTLIRFGAIIGHGPSNWADSHDAQGLVIAHTCC